MTNQAVNTPTVLSSWTRVLVSALQDRGVATDPLVIDAGLDPASVSMPDRRFPLTATTRLWQLAALETGDESLGLWVSRHSTHTTFHALGYAFMASRTLLEAMKRVVRFNGMVSDAANVELIKDGKNYTMRWTMAQDAQPPAHEAMEAVIAAILRACRRLSGRDFGPTRVQLIRPIPSNQQSFHEFFRCAIDYGRKGYQLTFRCDDLERLLPESNEDLARSNDRLGEEYLARLDLGSTAARLRTILVNELPSGVRSHDHYAELLGMSGRSLQRKLSDEGTTFNQVLSETRCDLAKSYLKAGQRHSLTEIAFLLGFSDASSFSRAFHRWTGTSPSSYSAN